MNKGSHFSILILMLAAICVPAFAQSAARFAFRSDRERAGLLGNIKKVSQKIPSTEKPATLPVYIRRAEWEYDCEGNLLKKIEDDGEIASTYLYEIFGRSRKLKYQSVSSVGRLADMLYRRAVRDQEGYERYFILYSSFDVYKSAAEQGKWDGFVLDESAYTGLEIVVDNFSPSERTWRNTYVFDSQIRLTDFRSVNAGSLNVTRKTYTYEKDRIQPAAMNEEQDFKTVGKSVYRYELDESGNWKKRFSEITRLYSKVPETAKFAETREYAYFSQDECRAPQK